MGPDKVLLTTQGAEGSKVSICMQGSYQFNETTNGTNGRFPPQLRVILLASLCPELQEFSAVQRAYTMSRGLAKQHVLVCVQDERHWR